MCINFQKAKQIQKAHMEEKRKKKNLELKLSICYWCVIYVGSDVTHFLLPLYNSICKWEILGT